MCITVHGNILLLRINAHGYGEERLVVSNATAAGRAENRGVESIQQDQ